MSQGQPLRQEISPRFSEAIDARLGPGESVLVSLPGSYGEALVMTEKRAFVIRERAGGADPETDIYPYWLTTISTAHAEAQGTSGFIHLDVDEAKSDPDRARVYFPAYDLEKFKAAADLVAMLKQSAPVVSVTSAAASADPAPSAAGGCCKCGTALPHHAVFCSQCGEQQGPVCLHCGMLSAEGAAHCIGCGNKMVESPTSCPSCGSRITRYQTYCGECGSVLVMSCAGCGTMVYPNDKHCRSCGRLLGTDRIDPRAARAMHARAMANAQARAQTAEEEPAAEKTSEEESAPGTEAGMHNQRGNELFEQEDVEGAVREFETAVRLEPTNASYHCNLAVAYDEADEDEKALQEYEKTLLLDPNDLTALLSLGYLYNENDEPDRAKEVWEKVLRIAPLSAEAQEVQDNLRHQGQL